MPIDLERKAGVDLFARSGEVNLENCNLCDDNLLVRKKGSVCCGACGANASHADDLGLCSNCGANLGFLRLGKCSDTSCSHFNCTSCGDSCQVPEIFSECDIAVLNDLICQLRVHLKDTNSGCFAFSASELARYLRASLSEFNGTPTFTGFTFATLDLVRFRFIVVEGAVLLALSAQTLIESGREFVVNDNGISFQPPPISATMAGQHAARFSQYKQDLQYIKEQFKPSPMALLAYQSLNNGGLTPPIARLRHLKDRRIF